jgi:DNA-binding transcriptional MerR regulator
VLDPGTRSRPDTFNVTPTASDTRPLRSGELARRAGVSPDTLRHYERRGLLPRPERSAAGYRLYSLEALRRVRLIRGALSIGFTVNELGAILADRDRGGAPCRRVRTLAADKLAAVELQLRTLRLWRRELRTALADWDRRLKATPRGKRAGLLDAFVVAHLKSTERSSPLLTPNLRKRKVLREERKCEK